MVEIDYALKISVAVRMFLTQLIYITFVTVVMHHCLDRRKSYKYLIVWELLRLIFINELMGIVLEEVRMVNWPLQVVYSLAYLFAALFTLVVYLFTFDDVPKTIFLYVFVEPLAVFCGLPGQIITSMIQNRSAEYEIPLIPSDVIMYLIDILVMGLAIRLARPLFQKIRKMEVKRPRFWSGFLFFYILSASLITTLSSLSIIHTVTIIVAMLTFAGLVSYTITNAWYLWQKQIRFQNDYLKRQKELYSIHYDSIQRQIMQMERAQKEIDEQMKKIS